MSIKLLTEKRILLKGSLVPCEIVCVVIQNAKARSKSAARATVCF